MVYHNMQNSVMVRLDPGDEIISGILTVCREEHIESAIFQGIGGCKEILRLGYNAKTDQYEEQLIQGNLDMGSILGNITMDEDGNLCHHTHTVFSSVNEKNEEKIYAGHTLRAVVSYAAEIEIRPVLGGKITRTVDALTGAQIWHF